MVALAAGSVPFLTACGIEDVIRFGWPGGITPQAEAMRQLWTWSAIAALIIGAITWGAMFWAVVFHRKKAGESDEVLPRQTQYNLPLEIAFTVIPTIIVAVLFGFTVLVQNYVTADEPTDMNVDIVAKQWNWEFAYPGQTTPDGEKVATIGTSDVIPILVLPTNRSITFDQHSLDVVHSFFVPEFLFKLDVFPMPERNDQDHTWRISEIEREGAFVGRCAELCGSYHSQMNFEVRALSPDKYDQWIGFRKQLNPATGAPYTAGEALAAVGCADWCQPTAITTYPFANDRTQRSASLPPDAAGS
ncbi:MAG: cytochrome c oxidase subunit II [Pseudonocardia sp.]|nr:cytochrome c oxidase subunit II [Pseudonocardia sp.]